MAIEDFYIESTRKTINTNTKNSKYENVKGYTESSIMCYVGSRTAIEQFSQGKWTIKSQYKFFADTECSHGDIIVYKSENYRIVSDPQNTINADHHFKAFVEKMENVN